MVGGGQGSPPPKDKEGGKSRSGSARRDRPKAGGEVVRSGGFDGDSKTDGGGASAGGNSFLSDGEKAFFESYRTASAKWKESNLTNVGAGRSMNEGSKNSNVSAILDGAVSTDVAARISSGSGRAGPIEQVYVKSLARNTISGNGGAVTQVLDVRKTTGGSRMEHDSASLLGSVQNLFNVLHAESVAMDCVVNAQDEDGQVGSMLEEEMQVVGKQQDTIMADFQFSSQRSQAVCDNASKLEAARNFNSVFCAQGVCDNAATNPLVDFSNGAGGSHLGSLSLGGKEGDLLVGRLDGGRWADEVDAAMADGVDRLSCQAQVSGLVECMQGVRRYAPTMQDVEFTLENASVNASNGAHSRGKVAHSGARNFGGFGSAESANSG